MAVRAPGPAASPDFPLSGGGTLRAGTGRRLLAQRVAGSVPSILGAVGLSLAVLRTILERALRLTAAE
jgi:hypothetical protein